MVLVRILGCCLLFAVSGVRAQDAPLRWLINDFPPFTETGAQMPGRGISADMLRYLQRHLPQYQHRFEAASFARAYALLEHDEAVCHPAMLKAPERERIMLFSRPVLFLPAQQVLIRAEHLPQVTPYLDSEGRVDVRRLLADAQLVTAISERRGYSRGITSALDQVGARAHVLKAGVKFDAPFQQLMAGWIDYLFAYPVELGWYLHSRQAQPAVPLNRLAIAGDPPYMYGYIACARSAWGEQVISDINQQLRQAGARPPWVETILAYLDPEQRQIYERALVELRPFAQP